MERNISRTRQLAKSSLSILLSHGLITVISLVFIAYFARVFSKEQMAVYATLTILSGWTSLLGGMGMGTLVEKEVAQLEAEGQHLRVKKLITSALVYRTGLMVLITLIFYLSSSAICFSFFHHHDYLDLIRFVILISFVLAFFDQLEIIQVASQRFVSRSAINVVTVLSQRAFCVIGFFLGGVSGFFWGFLLGTLIGVLLCLLDIRKYLCWRLIPFLEIFKASWPYFGLVMLKGATDKIDRPLVAAFLGAEALAGYHVAKRLFDNIYALVNTIVVPAGVKFGEVRGEGGEALEHYYRQTLVLVSSLFIPLGIFIMIAAKSLLLLYAGPKYVNTFPVLAAFGFTLMGLPIWSLVRQAGLRLVSPRHLASQYILTSAATFLVYFLLLPLLGEVGIPIAMGFGYIVGVLPIVFQLKTQQNLRFPLHQVFISGGCGFCILAVNFPVSELTPGLFHLTLASFLSGLTYLAWLHYIGPPDIARFLKNQLSKIPKFRLHKII
ncbi:MAG: oligosaccharide flippase family protein [Deltaproteobacteria bacterium]|nr:oligosaccharide flippase family protein [Deltaproteobacteria bacterium]